MFDLSRIHTTPITCKYICMFYKKYWDCIILTYGNSFYYSTVIIINVPIGKYCSETRYIIFAYLLNSFLINVTCAVRVLHTPIIINIVIANQKFSIHMLIYISLQILNKCIFWQIFQHFSTHAINDKIFYNSRFT